MARINNSAMDKILLARQMADAKYRISALTKQIYNCPVCGPKIQGKINMMVESASSKGIGYCYSDTDWLTNGGIEDVLCGECRKLHDELLKQKFLLDSFNQVVGRK